jgi:phage tail protein X
MAAAVPKRQYARKADIVRAVEAARACGLAVQALDICPDGTIRLLPGAAPKKDGVNDFEAWEAAGRL